MENEDYKTSENVDMRNPDAVQHAAEQNDLSVGHYKACAEGSGTYNRRSIEKWIGQHYDYAKKQIIR